jgi:succinate dehydrogenase/fumarate reductase flavoprotein subunit
MEIKKYDLVCIGGGGAAVLAAVHTAAAGKKVAVVTKDYAGFGNTRMAVGMTACPGISPNDSIEDFSADLISSGEGLNEPALVKSLTEKAAQEVANLEELGPIFRRDRFGGFSAQTVSQLGGHSHPRTLVNLGGGPALGAALKGALWRFNVDTYNNTAVLDLIKIRDVISGALALNLNDGEFIGFQCDTVLIATGGCGGLFYPHTTNNRGAVGDGLTLALNAGAVLWDVEQVQAIPFGITQPRSMAGALCGEPSTAGPAGRLLDGNGSVLLEQGINKMTRAAVTRVMMDAIAAGKATSDGELFLDLSPNLMLNDGESIYQNIRDSGIFDIVKLAYGKDAYHWKEPWSVLPTMHYLMGGIRANKLGETGIPGLMAVGEVQAGIHGGNRLGSVALSEIFTFGAIVGRHIGIKTGPVMTEAELKSELIAVLEAKLSFWNGVFHGNGQYHPAKLRIQLEDCMWRLGGPVRCEKQLLQALSEFDHLADKLGELLLDSEEVVNRQLRDAVELCLMLPAARALVLSALERRESRGAHLRSDYTATDDKGFLCHTFVRINRSGTLESGLMPLES